MVVYKILYVNVLRIYTTFNPDYFLRSLYLYYLGKDTVSNKTFNLPEGCEFVVDIIDTQNMTVKGKGIYSGRFAIEMPEKQYIAIRIYENK